jgi:ribosomal protein S3AE
MVQAKKKKKFFDVEMPIINRQTQIFAFDISELENKFINYDLTRILRGKSVVMQLKVKIEENKATSTPTQITLMPYFIRRMIRKGTDYVEDSFSAECKDAQLRIKPFLITRRKVSREIKRALREKAKEEIIKEIKDKPSERIFESILKNKLQKDLSLILKKIYPLSLCEIRILKIEKNLETKEKSSKEIVEEKKEKIEEEKEVEEKHEKKEKIKEKERNSEEVKEE